MEYRQLPHADLNVSRVSFGTMTFGSQTDEAAATRIVNRCIEAGINFFDTANAYNLGRSETILGKALGPRRANVILATKVFNRMGDAPDDRGLSRAAVHKALAAMDEVVRAGKVRFPAVSNYAAWQVAEIHALAKKNGYKPPHISQPMYNLVARGIEEEYLPFCRRFGVAVVPYNPLAGGLLTGKQTRERGPIAGTRFNGNKMYQDRYWHDDYFAAVDELSGVAREAAKTLVELAFQWLLSQPVVDSIILGASRLEQLEENLKACEDGPLDSATLARCDAVWKRLRGITPKYNR